MCERSSYKSVEKSDERGRGKGKFLVCVRHSESVDPGWWDWTFSWEKESRGRRVEVPVAFVFLPFFFSLMKVCRVRFFCVFVGDWTRSWELGGWEGEAS